MGEKYEKFGVSDDTVYRYVPIGFVAEDGTMNYCRMEAVMDKETFIKCYNRWIKGESEVEE